MVVTKLDRYELLILDALKALETSVRPVTCQVICEFILPRVTWVERRLGIYTTVWIKLIGLVNRGWIEDERLGPVSEQTWQATWAYRIKRHTWRVTDHHLKGDPDYGE